MTVNGGGEPNAWNIAHRTAMSKPHHAGAPSRPASRERIRSIAVRTPLDASAGTVDRASDPVGETTRAGRSIAAGAAR